MPARAGTGLDDDDTSCDIDSSRRGPWWRWAAPALVVGAGWLLTACHANGEVFEVTTTADTVDVAPGDGVCADAGGTCSLRAAFMEANALAGVDAIVLADDTTYTLSIAGTGEDASASGDLDVTEGVDLRGDRSTIDANGIDRVVDLHAGSGHHVHLTGVTLTGGIADRGAALRDHSGTDAILATLVEIHGNTATSGSPVEVVDTDLRGIAVTFADNTGDEAGAVGVFAGSATLTNATFSGNTGGTAGALFTNGGTADIRSSTFVANDGNIRALAREGGAISVTGTVLGEGQGCYLVASGGHNVDHDGACGLAGPGDVSGLDTRLGSLADHGGGVRTVVPFADSPVIDAFDGAPGACTQTSDARSAPRPVGTSCDAGAVEWDGVSLVVNHGGDDLDATPGDGVCQDATGAAGACSLRAAVGEVNATTDGGRITVDGAVGTVTLSRDGAGDDDNLTGDLDLAATTLLDGGGATVDAASLATGDRVLHVDDADLAAHDLTLTGGDIPGSGGGIDLDGGVLVLEDATVTGNSAGTRGGGVYAVGPTTIRATHISGNAATNDGGGLWVRGSTVLVEDVTIGNNTAGNAAGGASVLSDTGVVRRSLLVDNHSSGDVGGLRVSGVASLRVEGSTVSGNSADGVDGGVFAGGTSVVEIIGSTVTDNTVNVRRASGATMLVGGSILADPSSRLNCANSHPPTSLGYNVVSDASCGFAAVGDLESTDPLLGALADNGGPTRTHLPAGSSPAVERVPVGTAGLCDGSLATDQRGVDRPQRVQCDSGAVEVAVVAFTVDGPGDTTDASPGDGLCADGSGDCTLRAAIDETNALAGPDTIVIDPAVTTIGLSIDGTLEDANASGDLDIADALTIEGNGATVDASSLPSGDRVLHADGAYEIHIADLTVTGGAASFASGISIDNGGTLHLERVTIRNNVADNAAGLRVEDSTAHLTDTTIRNNHATVLRAGGVLVIGASTFEATGTTISGNTTAGVGGGIAVLGTSATVDLVNTTVSGNTAGTDGGGIHTESPNTTLTSVTLSSNLTGGPGANLAGPGTATLAASVLADPLDGADCGGTLSVVSAGYNHASDTSCGLATTGDAEGTDPALAGLADNGGATRTHLPNVTSPALDAIPGGTPSLCDGTYATDQRGVARPQGTGCDKGAVER